MSKLRIGLAGATGRMGESLIAVLRNHLQAEIAALWLREGATPPAGLSPDLEFHESTAFVAAVDAVIDFTSPEASLILAKACGELGVPLVCGTTGFTESQFAELKQASAGAPILWASNMSVGIALLSSLIEQAARQWPDADIEIVEMHHKLKKDAPSGTALTLGEAAAAGRGVALKEAAVHSREGLVGERTQGAIGFAVLRGGDVVGDHRVILAGDGEMLELAHRATSRAVFAQGAVRAALWLKEQKPGWYALKDMFSTAT